MSTFAVHAVFRCSSTAAARQALARFLTLLFRETYKLGPHRLTSSMFFRYYERPTEVRTVHTGAQYR